MGISWYLLGLLTCFLASGCEKVVGVGDTAQTTSSRTKELLDSAGYYLDVCEIPDSSIVYLEQLRPLCESASDLAYRYNALLLNLAWLTRNYEEVITLAGPNLLHVARKGETISGQDPHYLNMAAHALRKLGDTTAAIKLYEYLAELDLLAMRRGARANLLMLYSKRNWHARAIELAKEIEPIELMNPNDISAHLSREYYWARSLAAIGKSSEAMKHMRRMLTYLQAPRPNYNRVELRVRLSTARSMIADSVNLALPIHIRTELQRLLRHSMKLDSTVLQEKFGTSEAPKKIISTRIPKHLFLTPRDNGAIMRATSLRDLTVTAQVTDSHQLHWYSTLHGLYVKVGDHLVKVALPMHQGLTRPVRSIDVSRDTMFVCGYDGKVWPISMGAIIGNHTSLGARTPLFSVRPLSPRETTTPTTSIRLSDTTTLIGTSSGLVLDRALSGKHTSRTIPLRESLNDTVVALYRRKDTIIVASHALGTRAILQSDAEAGRPRFFPYDGFKSFSQIMMGPAITDLVIKHLHGDYNGAQRPVVDELYPTTILRMYLTERNDAVLVGTRGISVTSKRYNKAQILPWPDSLRSLFEAGFYTTLTNDSTLDVSLRDRIITVHLERMLRRDLPQFLVACLSKQRQPQLMWLTAGSPPITCGDSLTLAIGSSAALSDYHPMTFVTGSWNNRTLTPSLDGLYHLSIPNVRSCSLQLSSVGLIQSGTLQLRPSLHPLMYQDVLIILMVLSAGSLAAGTVVLWQRNAERNRKDLEQQQSMMARDLHDTVGSDLARLSALLNATEAQQSRMIVSAALAANRKFRSLLWIWRSDSISVAEFLGELREYASACFADADIKLTARPIIIDEDQYVDADIAKNVLIILNESITNIIRHASASHVALNLRRDGASITIELSDNGRGFDVDQLTRKSGINNIAERAAENGFHARVESIPQSGTRVIVSFGVYTS